MVLHELSIIRQEQQRFVQVHFGNLPLHDIRIATVNLHSAMMLLVIPHKFATTKLLTKFILYF
jgi:hypothetical protein